MAIFTKDRFSALAQRKAGTRTFSTFVNESRKYSRILYKTSVFLSHSHADKSFVEKVTTVLRQLGVDVYVDWADETMPERTSGVTAQKIKEKIKSNDKFILLATNTAIASKWCNWELGYGDAFKYPTKKICILPLADTSNSWTGNEYLQIYPRIEEDSPNANEQIVIFPDGSRERLTVWLNR